MQSSPAPAEHPHICAGTERLVGGWVARAPGVAAPIAKRRVAGAPIAKLSYVAPAQGRGGIES